MSTPPEEIESRIRRVSALLDEGRPEDALNEVTPLRAHPERGGEVGLLIARCLVRLERYLDAVRELKATRELPCATKEQRKDATYFLGRIYQQAGKKDKAIEEFNRVVQIADEPDSSGPPSNPT